MSKQIVKVVIARDFRFYHIDAGVSPAGLPRTATETSVEEIGTHLVNPSILQLVFTEFPELKHEVVGVQLDITWV